MARWQRIRTSALDRLSRLVRRRDAAASCVPGGHGRFPADAIPCLPLQAAGPRAWSGGTASPADDLAPPMVLNDDDAPVTEQLLVALVRVAFDAHGDGSVTHRLLQARPRTLAEAHDVLDRIVRADLAGGTPAALERAASWYGHLRRRDANKTAYSPRDKAARTTAFWPDPRNPRQPRSIYDELPFTTSIPLIDRSTPIVSAGSCFAMEIAHRLQADGFHYLVKEPNVCPAGTYVVKDAESRPPLASAAWGIIFNTPSFAQLAERAFGLRRPSNFLFEGRYRDRPCYCDPMREEVLFPSVAAYVANRDVHLRNARAAFEEARVLIITLGLNEVWFYKPDGAAFSRSPWRTAPSLVESRILTVAENVAFLQRMLDVVRSANPRLEVIVTLSPIPLHATACGDRQHVITANAHSKAVQRVAIDEFIAANHGVHYFPSYELVTHCIRDPWAADQRHVTPATVDRVMTLFYRMYAAGQAVDRAA